MKDSKFIFYIGTVAELIKLAPVIKEMTARNIDFSIISSGQNILGDKELQKIFGTITVDIKLSSKMNPKKSSLLNFIKWSIKSFSNTILIFLKYKNRERKYVIVHGDTVSSVIGAFCAKITGYSVIHVEAGLRSFNFLEPFPEEISRVIISRLADLHFCPNEWSFDNLDKKVNKINTKQNTVYESINLAQKKKKLYPLPAKIRGRRYFLLIIHRQEHVMFNQSKTVNLFKSVVDNIPDNYYCLLLMHKLTESLDLEKQIKKNKKLLTIPRQKYGTFVNIMENAEFIITDGGSNQEEAFYLGKPCLVLRNVTERIEGLGKNALLANDDTEVIKKFIKNYKRFKIKKLNKKVSPSKIIVDNLVKLK